MTSLLSLTPRPGVASRMTGLALAVVVAATTTQPALGESLFNSGSIEQNGVRRIKVTPRKAPEAAPGAEAGTGIAGLKDKFFRAFGGSDDADGDTGKDGVAGTGKDWVADGGKDGGKDGSTGANGMTSSGAAERAFAKALDPLGKEPMQGPGASLGETLTAISDERDAALRRAQSFGQMMHEQDLADGIKARQKREAAAAAKAARAPTAGEKLYAEFGRQPQKRTPYEVSREAVQSGD